MLHQKDLLQKCNEKTKAGYGENNRGFFSMEMAI